MEHINPGILNKEDIRIYSSKRLFKFIPYIAFCIVIYFGFSHLYRRAFCNTPTIFSLFFDFISPITFIVFIWSNAAYTFLYYFEIPFFEKYKVNNLEWPWKENPEKWKKGLKKLIFVHLLNNLILFPLFHFAFSFSRSISTSPEELPSFFTFVFHILICVFAEDFTFYWGHRLLHTPLFYQKIHKHHHSQYNVTYFAHAYAHWAEFVFGNLVPLYFGAFVLGKQIHAISFLAFIVYRAIETSETHSGYEFPWSIFQALPYTTDSSYHNHHHLINIGNYGSFSVIWDNLFKTNLDYFGEFNKQAKKSK